MGSNERYFPLLDTDRDCPDGMEWEEWQKSLNPWRSCPTLENPMRWEWSRPPSQMNLIDHTLVHAELMSNFSSPSFTNESLEPVPYLSDRSSPSLTNNSHESWRFGGKTANNTYASELEIAQHTAPGLPILRSSKNNSISGLRINLPTEDDFVDTESYGERPQSAPTMSNNGAQHINQLPPNSQLLAPRSKRMLRKTDYHVPDSQIKKSSPKTQRSSLSETSPPGRVAKLAHNIVERNYRDRLNDQITELSTYLFDLSADTKLRSKPPKCLVISRAKERLMELTDQNNELQGQVAMLKQQIAVLDHIVARDRDPS